MMAVEDRMQAMTDVVFAHLFQAAHDHAQQLAEMWEAFGRFCRTRVGPPLRARRGKIGVTQQVFIFE